MSRRPDDYNVDVDAASTRSKGQQADMISLEQAIEREKDRLGTRDLDARLEAMPTLTRAQKDRERINPRSTVAPLGHTRLERHLPAPGEVRSPISSRQKKERSKARVAAQGSLPQVQYEAQRELMTNPQRWISANDALSNAVGDIQALPEPQQEELKRVDRSIQRFERHNDRGHVIYSNVELPMAINQGNIEGFVHNQLPPGARISLDRYTYGTHQMHETAAQSRGDAGRSPLLEIQTRRGAYLGHSDSMDDTSHLLPRGMSLEVVGSHWARYTTPAGEEGRRYVIQLRDVTPEPANRPKNTLRGTSS